MSRTFDTTLTGRARSRCKSDFGEIFQIRVLCVIFDICVELIKQLPVHRHSFDIFFISGPSGILGSGESRIPLKLVLEGVRIVALSINSHEQTQYNRICCFLILKIHYF